MVEEASEFFKEIRLAMTERLTSPLVGTYWVSWLIWNFKFILIVFSGLEIGPKLQLIHDEMFIWPWGYVCTYGAPAVMTGLFIFFYPYPAEVVYQFRLKYQHKLSEIRQKEEGEELLSVEESRRLRLEIRDKERKITQRLDDAEKEISDLRRENESLRGRIPNKEETSKATGKKGGYEVPVNRGYLAAPAVKPAGVLSGIETAVIKAIASVLPETVSEKWIIDRVLEMDIADEQIKTRAKVRAALNKLEETYKVIYTVPGGGYRLTPKGEKFALDNDF